LGNLKGRYNSEDLGVDVWIILKWVLGVVKWALVDTLINSLLHNMWGTS
jgi:hypothetical protein